MLELKNVTKTFHPGTADEKVALDNVSLSVREGDFISIIGANGAGKSTLFNAICGSFFVDRGSILLAGKNITMVPEHRRARTIGRLFQDPMRGSAPDMSIEENLSLAAGNGGWLSRMSAADRRDFRDRLKLLGMGLEERMKAPVGLLSGGQRQALTLLMATYHAPQLLLLDEHTAALDPGTAEKVLNLTPRRGGKPHHLPHDHAQHAVRPRPGQPHADDGPRPDHLRRHRRRALRPDRRRPDGPVPAVQRPCPGQRPDAAFLTGRAPCNPAVKKDIIKQMNVQETITGCPAPKGDP